MFGSWVPGSHQFEFECGYAHTIQTYVDSMTLYSVGASPLGTYSCTGASDVGKWKVRSRTTNYGYHFQQK